MLALASITPSGACKLKSDNTSQQSILYHVASLSDILSNIASQWPPWRCSHWARAVRLILTTLSIEHCDYARSQLPKHLTNITRSSQPLLRRHGSRIRPSPRPRASRSRQTRLLLRSRTPSLRIRRRRARPRALGRRQAARR
jgi:hypothetical protein